LVLLYTYECDLGDGWEDAEVNNDPLAVLEKQNGLISKLHFNN
jgi:hypothetical protein